MREPLLAVEKLSIAYREIQVLRDISLTVYPGEIVTIVGANAAGKTTLVSCISRVLTHFTGNIRFDGQDISCLSPAEIVNLGLIQCPEGRLLFPGLTVRENLELGAFAPRSRANRRERLERIYELLPRLKEKSEQLAGSLSGGEAQMCAIGRSLMANPKLLILDEPSLGLAPVIVKEIMKMIKRFRQEGMSILLVEQNVRQSLKLCDRAYVLENGRIVLEGSGEELLENERVRRAYLGI